MSNKVVKTKRRCCKSRPRCKNCPVVWRRLEAAGMAERLDRRHWRTLAGKIPKSIMKLMRA